MFSKLKAYWARIKPQLAKFETWVKTVFMTILGGGIAAIAQVYQNGQQFVLSADNLVRLKGSFLSGCVLALIAYWSHSPLLPPAPPLAK